MDTKNQKRLEEEELLRQLRNNKTRESAFTRLVHLYQESLYWQIRRIVLTHENADDVLQNVFLKAWNAIDTFQGNSQLRTWLYRIATNESLNYIQRLHEEGSIDDASSLVQSLHSDPYFDGEEVEEQLQEAITQLPEKQRIVFLHRYFDETPYEELSLILNTSVGALKASYHHAVKKIAEFFKSLD